MGHERLGVLPKTKRWNKIVEELQVLSSSDVDVAHIASETLKNVQERFESLYQDSGVRASFAFMLIFAVMAREQKIQNFMKKPYLDTTDKLTLTDIARAINDFVGKEIQSQEYSEIAKRSTVKALASWYDSHKRRQLSLFDSFDNALSVWKELGNGSSFCEVTRLFFSNFTEYYLKYFLAREASAVLPSIIEREAFDKNLHKHIEDISQYAFETSKITQSFAAGWFNKWTKDRIPTEKEIIAFLKYAFGKMREELLRET
jgi:uncharacterized membrane-anchored protein YjiN (DUF445 family)